MKILLLGEYSGVHNNFKRIFKSKGHNVTLVANGDGFKKFEYDLNVSTSKSYFDAIINILKFYFNINKFIGNDVVQFNSPLSLPIYFNYFGCMYFIFKFNKRIVYYTGGTDIFLLNSKDEFKYFPFNEDNILEIPKFSKSMKSYSEKFISNVDLIIPPNYLYFVPYKSFRNIAAPVQFPKFNLDVLENEEEKNDFNKIRIIYPRTRDGFKGSKYILPALLKIADKYKKLVEVKVLEKINFDEFRIEIQKYDILVDQCNSYDYGMGALLGLQCGLVVLSGSENESLEYLKIENCPVINILPDTDFIFNKIEELILNPELISQIKINSIKYSNEFHNDDKIYELWIKNIMSK
jgi:hypothetical protein